MCGICGIIGRPSPDTASRIGRMMDRMAHRGPDGRGMWLSDDGTVALGHVRLAIVDTSEAGTQPMHHPAGLHSVVNGEIYNYPTLRRGLEKECDFQSQCDSEIVLHGHQVHGAGFMRELDGMFASALYDARDRTITLARDRLGIKPLYYIVIDGSLLFASEIKALLGAINADCWTIDRQGLSEYLTYQSPLGANTLFAGVRQVLPGHMLRISTGQPSEFEDIAYWQAKPSPDSRIGFDDAVAAFDKVFKESVDRHLLSDVPVASYLSAGFDSASVFAEAAGLYCGKSGDGLTAYTGRFDRGNAWYDETVPAAELASALGTRHRTVDIDASALTTHLDAITDALDEPRMGMGALSQYMVARTVADDYKVILSGHGGDELFSGYPVFAYAQNGLTGMRKLSEFPHFAYFSLSDMEGRTRKEAGRGLPVLWPVAEQAKMTGSEQANIAPWTQLETWTGDAASASDRILLTYLKAYLPGLLVVEDKISMAHSLESRTPILDNQMLDLSLSIPYDVKLRGGRLKAIVKEHARKALPESYFSQPKRGFPTPLSHWLRGELAGFADERLSNGDNHLQAILCPDFTRRFAENYRSSWRRKFRPLDEIQSHRMWQLLSLESWVRVWAEKYGVALRLP